MLTKTATLHLDQQPGVEDQTIDMESQMHTTMLDVPMAAKYTLPPKVADFA